MIPVILPPSVTSNAPTFASTIRLIASKTVAVASTLKSLFPFSLRICETLLTVPSLHTNRLVGQLWRTTS